MKTEWIAVDWGTSHLRAWAMQGDTVLDQAQSDLGMARVAPGAFQSALLALVQDWLGDAPVDVDRLRHGWRAARLGRSALCRCPLGPGTKCAGSCSRHRSAYPGLYRAGSETSGAARCDAGRRNPDRRISGRAHQNWDGVLCLPGTHTKWVQVSAGEVISFRTFMTGEMFDLLCGQSVLKHSVGEGWDDAAFAEAAADTLSKPENWLAVCLGCARRTCCRGRTTAIARARLSGLLIGAELAATRPYWLGQQLAIIGADEVSKIYAQALQQQGAFVETADATLSTLAGLALARTLTKETA